MSDDQTAMLETLLVAQVLTLAKAIEAEKRAKGASSSDHYVPEAVQLIAQRRGEILAQLLRTR